MPCYTLQTTGRYQHSEVYIQELAEKNNLKLLNYSNVAGRQQENQIVNTGLFIFQKTS
jgi:predicted TPR repeat methyltransferase